MAGMVIKKAVGSNTDSKHALNCLLNKNASLACSKF